MRLLVAIALVLLLIGIIGGVAWNPLLWLLIIVGAGPAGLAAALDPHDRVAACLSLRRTLPTPSAPESGPWRDQAAAALAGIPNIIQTVVNDSIAQLGTFKTLCGWQPVYFARNGVVDQWAENLQGDPSALRGEPALPTPRLVISGGLAAWSSVSALEDEKEAERARANLTENLLTIIPQCAEEGVRAAEIVKQSAPDHFAEGLADLLRQDASASR